eukprot:scaffold15463_cov100-Skeletonema_dohrnii-CCMP3373.AAC.1
MKRAGRSSNVIVIVAGRRRCSVVLFVALVSLRVRLRKMHSHLSFNAGISVERHEDVAVTYTIVIACSTKMMIDQWRFGFGKLFLGIPAKEIDI